MFAKYLIEDTEIFDEHQYPDVVMEIADLQQSLFSIKSIHKAEIVVSLLKDHSIKTELLSMNKELARLLTSGALPTLHLESMFDSCKGKIEFLKGLESFIAVKIA